MKLKVKKKTALNYDKIVLSIGGWLYKHYLEEFLYPIVAFFNIGTLLQQLKTIEQMVDITT